MDLRSLENHSHLKLVGRPSRSASLTFKELVGGTKKFSEEGAKAPPSSQMRRTVTAAASRLRRASTFLFSTGRPPLGSLQAIFPKVIKELVSFVP